MTENYDLERVIIIHDGIAYFPNDCNNQRGFIRKETNAIIENNKWDDAIVLSIKGEIEKYGLQGDPLHKALLDTECYEFYTWRNCYLNRNINVTKLPIHISSNGQYEDRLDKELKIFQNEINRPPFVYDTDLIESIKSNCKYIRTILANLLQGKYSEAEKQLKELLVSYLDNEFIVNDLNYSYSFRGLAPYDDLHSTDCTDYASMMNEQLTFFRTRTKLKVDKSKEIINLGDIVHLPYNRAEYATDMRFNKAKEPCLYLGVTSFVCAKESRWDASKQDLYGSVFVPNSKGLKLKILNLTLSQYLINGMSTFPNLDDEKERRVQAGILKLYPLVLAISFSISEPYRNVKYEYLISQCLMKALHEVGIDGIAYLSAQGKDEFQYPHGVNLAFPAFDISEDNWYSKYCQMFEISEPVAFNNQIEEKHKSYINKIYKRCYTGSSQENFFSKIFIDGKKVFYGDTKYANYDNYLCSLEKHSMNLLTGRKVDE